jgi:hypothetical protein
MDKAIVFYCKDCGELFFATVKSKRNIRDVADEIIEYLIEGHEIKEIDIKDDGIKLGKCLCVR